VNAPGSCTAGAFFWVCDETPLETGGESGAARHICGLAHRLPLHAVPAGARGDSKPFGRARAQKWLSAAVRQQLLDAIYAGQPIRSVLRDLNLTPNQVWGLPKTDHAWSAAHEAALTATRRDDLKHGTNAAYVQGCVCVSVESISGSGRLRTAAKRPSLVVRRTRSRRWRAWDGDVLLASIVGNLANPIGEL
jgi:hypothetical protein